MKKILIIILSVLFVFTTEAADFDLYGNFSLGTWWMRREHFYSDTMGFIIDTINDSVFDKDSIAPVVYNDWVPTGSFGVKFKTGIFGGCIEFGMGKNIYDALLTGDPNLRLMQNKWGYYLSVKRWFAEWYINDMITFLTGQDMPPASFLQSNKILGYEQGYNFMGVLYTDFQPMFQITIQDPNALFEGKLAAIKIDTTLILIQDKTEAVTYVADSKIPKIEGSFMVNIDRETFGLNCKLAGGFQQYLSTGFNQQLDLNEAKQTITSYIVGGDLGVRVGPVSLICNGFHGKNIGTYGVKVGPFYGWWREKDFQYEKMFYPVHDEDTIKTATDTTVVWEIYNSTATEIAMIINVKPFEFLSFDGGFGIVLGDHELDEWNDKWQECLEGMTIESYSWYAQMELTISEQITIGPEVGQYVFGRWRGFGRLFYWGFNVGVDF
jgi:hypothetical protein